jgi:hypothetical protein
MKNLEKQIDIAAKSYELDSGKQWNSREAFIAGAKSIAAAEYHTHKLRIELVAKSAKLLCETRKEIRVRYSKEAVEEIIKNSYSYGYMDRDKDIGFESNLNYALEQLNK